MVGVPNTAAEPEKTSRGTPAAAIISSSTTVPTTLRRYVASGSDTDFPAYL